MSLNSNSSLQRAFQRGYDEQYLHSIHHALQDKLFPVSHGSGANTKKRRNAVDSPAPLLSKSHILEQKSLQKKSQKKVFKKIAKQSISSTSFEKRERHFWSSIVIGKRVVKKPLVKIVEIVKIEKSKDKSKKKHDLPPMTLRTRVKLMRKCKDEKIYYGK